MSKKSVKKSGGSSGTLVLLLLGLGCGCLTALSPDLALPLTILLLPGLIYLLIDRSDDWGGARAVLLLQAAACVGPISDAWYQCSGIDSCMSVLVVPTTVLWVWLAGATAWLLSQLLPIGLKMLNEMRLRHYRAALTKRREVLQSEWGIEKPVSD